MVIDWTDKGKWNLFVLYKRFLGDEDTINENRVLAMQWVFFQDWSIDFSQDTVYLVSIQRKSRLYLPKAALLSILIRDTHAFGR